MWYKKSLVLIFLVLGFDIKSFGAIMNEYIITETDQPTSLDPLDGDQTQNLPVVRMIYSTPLEIDASDRITSLVLEKFNYDKKTQTIHWTVKKGLKYSNGDEITVSDVAFSVLRMALARPKFPVIDLIAGLNEWIGQASPLTTMPKGITIHGQDIAIKLTKDHPHPLFRFCLELFSIIPKKCGRYTIESRKENIIQFKKRSEMSGPEAISFKYVSAVQLPLELARLSSNSVIAGNESMYSFDDLEKFRKFDSFYY